MKVGKTIRRSVLPTLAFAIVWAAHYLYLSYFGVRHQWLSLDGGTIPLWRPYSESKDYWLGYSYALSLSFAVVQLRNYREERCCETQELAIGGVTVSGFLAVAGCYLIGCCGSPMLSVYLSLFGAAFLPFAKPLIAAMTTVFILLAYWYARRTRTNNRAASRANNCQTCS